MWVSLREIPTAPDQLLYLQKSSFKYNMSQFSGDNMNVQSQIRFFFWMRYNVHWRKTLYLFVMQFPLLLYKSFIYPLLDNLMLRRQI